MDTVLITGASRGIGRATALLAADRGWPVAINYRSDAGAAAQAAARLGSPGEYVDYAGSKAALDTLAIGLAKELGAEGVRVNAVRPGLIDTEIHATSGDPQRARRLGAATPIGRAGRAEEIAEAIVWLLSDAASYVTGALLDVAGGR